MNIKEIHDFIGVISDKEQAGYFPPATIDQALDRASLWLFNKYRTDYAKDIDSFTGLAPFKKKTGYSTTAAGVYAVPASLNFVQLLSLGVVVVDPTYGNRTFPAHIMKEDEVDEVLNSQLNPPSATHPCVEETQPASTLFTTTYTFYPAQTHAGTMRYLRRPLAPVFGFTQLGRQITYNSGTSVQLEWTEAYLNKVIFLAIHFLGINLDSRMLQELGMKLPDLNV